jgi:hypothetical protein
MVSMTSSSGVGPGAADRSTRIFGDRPAAIVVSDDGSARVSNVIRLEVPRPG